MKIKFSLLLIILATVIFYSCNDEGVDGPPSITRVRAINAELADSSFVTALPGQQIVIEGVNLSEIQEIYFNGYPAVFNPVYNTNTHVIVQVPINTPTPDRDPSVSNTIRIVTKGGETEYAFSVNPPAPLLQDIYNENTRPGDIMEITGQFLLAINEVVFPGGIVGTDIQTNDAGTLLRVRVPEDVTEAGYLTLRSPYGSTTSNFLVNNTKGPGVFANFNDASEPEFGWGWWGAIHTNDPELFPGNDGFYVRSTFANVGADNPGWWENNRNIAINNFSKVAVPTEQIGNMPNEYVLKFEINTRIPIRVGTVFLIRFKDQDRFSYELHPYALDPSGVFHTNNKWKTMSIALSEWKVSTIGDLIEPYGAVGLCNIGIVSKGAPIAQFDAAFDNFRIEKVVASQ